MDTNYVDRMADKRTIAQKYGKKEEGKLVPNKKYEHIQKVVDTGKTIKDVKTASDSLVSKRKNELFKRIKGHTIIKLINAQQQNQIESIYNMGDNNNNNNINNINNDFDENRSQISSATNKSQTSNVTAVTYATDMLGNLSEIDFLLLDTRDQMEYMQCHIREAISYEGVNLNRDKFLPEMYMMKSKEGKMIILYHNDEKNGIPWAQRLYEKGYDNVFFLSGGFEDFAKKYPEYLEGPDQEKYILMKEEADRKKEELMKKQNPKKNYKVVDHTKGPVKHTNVQTLSTALQKGKKNSINSLKNDLKQK